MKNKYEEEIDFKAVLKTPTRWFGLVYPLFFIAVLIGGIFYTYSISSIAQNKSEPLLPDSSSMFVDILQKQGYIQEGVQIDVVSVPTAENMAKGRELFKSNCSSCHGEEGLGNGPSGSVLNPKPRNFTQKDGWKNGRKISEMFKTMQEGISGSGMASYEYLPVENLFSIIHFIRGSVMTDPPKDTPDELKLLDATYSLAKGKAVMPQIPLAKAIMLQEKNGEIESINVKEIINILELTKKSDESDLFSKYISDPVRCITALTRDSLWRSNAGAFIRIIGSGYPENGFKTEALRINSSDAAKLQALLLRICKKQTGSL